MTTEAKAIATPDGEAVRKKGTDELSSVQRNRRTAEQVRCDHFNEVLAEHTFEQKINLIIELKRQVATELANRQTLATQAAELTNGL